MLLRLIDVRREEQGARRPEGNLQTMAAIDAARGAAYLDTWHTWAIKWSRQA